MGLSIGDAFPRNVTFLNDEGEAVGIEDLSKGKSLVLFFYPADHTPGCTKEACSFRDQYQDFQDAGADVVGISQDDAERHAGFQEKYQLPFPLLTDPKGTGAKTLGIKRSLGLLPGRETFIVDQEGKIAHIFRSQFGATQHVEEALRIVKDLA